MVTYLLLCTSVYAFDCVIKVPNAGPFSYGFFQEHVVDTSRKELYQHAMRCDYRELMIHVWYPIIKKNTVEHRHDCYPLIVFSHGLGGAYNGMSYTYLCAALAMYGFVVVAISHTYACKPIIFPDGRCLDYLFSFSGVQHQSVDDFFGIEIETWVADTLFVLDVCERCNACVDSVLYNMIDMSRIGASGHSLGGAVAVQVCRRDSRIRAAVNLDGPLYGEQATAAFYKPVLFIVGLFEIEAACDRASEAIRNAVVWSHYMHRKLIIAIDQFIQVMDGYAHKIVIKKTVHDSFTDYALLPPAVLQSWLIDGRDAHAMIFSYVATFFECFV